MTVSSNKLQKNIITRAAQDAASLQQSLNPAKPLTRENWLALGQSGFLNSCVNEPFGDGQYALTAVLTYEALGKAGLSRSHLFSMGAHLFGCVKAIDNLGTKAQKDLWLPKLCSGQSPGALAFTGLESGSRTDDVGVSYQDGDDIILRGAKTCVTNGPDADIFIVSANRAQNPSGMNLALFLVPAGTDGIKIEPIETQGLRASPMARIVFDDCNISRSQQLGSAGTGALLSVMVWERSCILAGFIGALDKDLQAVTKHFKTTSDKDGPLFRHQSISHKLAQLRADLEAARQTLYYGASVLDNGGDSLLSAATSKLKVSQTLVSGQKALYELMAGRAWQVELGGELGLAEAMQDVMGTLSASGSSNVQLNAIAARM